MLDLERDLSLLGDEPLGDLPDLAGLVDVLSLCLCGEQSGEDGHLDLLEEACSFLSVLEFLDLPDSVPTTTWLVVPDSGLEVEGEEDLEEIFAFGRSD